MLISTHATPSDIEPAVNWISSLVGTAIDKRLVGYEQQERANPLLARHFREHFALEFGLGEVRTHKKNTGRLPKGDEYHPLYGLFIAAHRIHKVIPLAAKNPFEGRLREAANGLNGLRPFAYEITIASHLMQKGWDVEFVDYSGVGRFDFLARRDSLEVEVECKTTTGDTGRKIHRQEVSRLNDLLLPATLPLADAAGCHRILITIPDRLGKSLQELEAIASAVRSALEQQGSAANDHARADYWFDGHDPWPTQNDPEILPFFEKRFGFRNANLLFHGHPGHSIVAVMVRSAKPDNVVDTIAAQAKDAANQCSGTRPALIALHLIDEIDRSDLQTLLAAPSELHAITHAVLKEGKRRHVDSIAFTVPQILRTDGRGAKWMSGNTVMLYNPEPLFPCAEIRSIFRTSA